MMDATKLSWLIFGGSFDPVHAGHLAIARAAAESVGAGGVLLMPTGGNPLKVESVASPEQRLAMLRLAVEGDPFFQISEMEIFRTGPCYTIDTVDALRKEGWGRLQFLIGSDMLADLDQWRDVERLLQEVQLIIACRPPLDMLTVQSRAEAAASRICPENPPALQVIRTPLMDISSSEIRRRLRHSESIDGLTPEPVADYIWKNKLYLD